MIHFLIFYLAERKQPTKKPSGNQTQTTDKTQEDKNANETSKADTQWPFFNIVFL
jgi:hypothetical protein